MAGDDSNSPRRRSKALYRLRQSPAALSSVSMAYLRAISQRSYKRKSSLGITSSHSTNRSWPYLLAYKPTKPRGANNPVKSHSGQGDCAPINPPSKGNAAISRQTPLLNTKRLLFHRLVCWRTASESDRHKRNPLIKPRLTIFQVASPPTVGIKSLANVCERPDEKKQECQRGHNFILHSTLNGHIRSI